jgi:hypothetical protein
LFFAIRGAPVQQQQQQGEKKIFSVGGGNFSSNFSVSLLFGAVTII